MGHDAAASRWRHTQRGDSRAEIYCRSLLPTVIVSVRILAAIYQGRHSHMSGKCFVKIHYLKSSMLDGPPYRTSRQGAGWRVYAMRSIHGNIVVVVFINGSDRQTMLFYGIHMIQCGMISMMYCKPFGEDCQKYRIRNI